jgi:hypothetical protein
MNDQIKEMLRKNFTVQARIMHPKLLTPEAKVINGNQGLPKFSAMVVIPKQPMQPALQEMMNFINQAMQTLHPGINPQVLVQPIKDADTYIRQDGKPNPDYVQGCFWLNAASGEKFPPVVVDQMRQPVISEAEIWSGRNAAVNMNFYNISGANGGKRGLGVNLNAVMLLEGGEKVAGAPTVDVNAAFGAFQSDMGMAAPQPVQQAPVQQPVAAPQPVQQAPVQAPNPWNAANPTEPQQQVAQAQPVNNPFAPNQANGNGYI